MHVRNGRVIATTLLAAAVVASVVSVAAARPAAAQEPPAPPPPAAAKDAVHTAWDEFRSAQEAMRAALQAGDMERAHAARTAVVSKQAAFKGAFGACAWKDLDPKAEPDLLGAGLQMLLNDALLARDGKTAVLLCDEFTSRLAGTPGAAMITSRVLPIAHVMSGDVEKAVAIWEKGAGDADGGVRADALLNIGDAKAARGDVAGARAAWQQVADVAVQGPKDPAGRLKPYAETRLALVGNAAPEIDAKTWIGGEAKPLSAHRGSVVILDFWATWHAAGRGAMKALDALARERKPDGLVVLGVTRFYATGLLPKAGAEDPTTGGEPVAGLTEATFQDHLKQFKTALGVAYPFVTATEADFKSLRVPGIPTTVLLDRAGKVAFVKIGGGDESMLRVAVDHLLATK